MEIKTSFAFAAGIIIFFIVTGGFVGAFYKANCFTIFYMGVSIVTGLVAGSFATLSVIDN
jgi:hypothetical protein